MQILSRDLQFSTRNISRDEFGPFKISEAIPWLFIATALRLFAKWNISIPISILCFVLMQCMIFMAFAATVDSALKDSGGKSRLGGHSLFGKIGLLKLVIRKVLAFQFYVLIACLLAGPVFDVELFGPAHKEIFHVAGSLFVSFSGIIYPDGFLITRMAAAVMAVFVFLLVIAAATDRPVTWRELATMLSNHWLAMSVAGICLVGIMHFIGKYELDLIRYLFSLELGGERAKAHIYLFVQTTFAFFRLWIAIFVLTQCLKWSYNQGDRAQA